MAASPATPETLPRRCQATASEVGAVLRHECPLCSDRFVAAPSDHSSSANSRFTRSRYERHGASEGNHGAGERQRATARARHAWPHRPWMQSDRQSRSADQKASTAAVAQRNASSLVAAQDDTPVTRIFG